MIVLNVYYYRHNILQIVVFISASHQNGKFIHLSDRLFVANISERQALIQIINNKIYHDTFLSPSPQRYLFLHNETYKCFARRRREERRATSVKCQKLPTNKAKFSMENRREGNEPHIRQSAREKITTLHFAQLANSVNKVKRLLMLNNAPLVLMMRRLSYGDHFFQFTL